MRLKGTGDELSLIASNLGVQYVLEGSVRRSGDSLRISTKLIEIASDSAIWAHKYSGTMEDVFTIQESISRGIVDALHVVLSDIEKQRLVDRPLADIRAYESYLKAKQEMHRFTKEGLDRALAFLQSSEKLVGENILLLSAKGQVYWQYVNAGIDNNPAYLVKARACAERILAIAPESEHGHRLLGLVLVHEGDVQGGVRSLKRALEIDPNDPDTLVWLCVFCGTTGKAAAARPWADRLKALDPLTPLFQVLPAILATMDGDFVNAIDLFAPYYAGNLDNPGVRLAYGQTLALGGKVDEALAIFRRARPRSPRESVRTAWSLLRVRPARRLRAGAPERDLRRRRDPRRRSAVFVVPRAMLRAGRRSRAGDQMARARGVARVHQLPADRGTRSVPEHAAIRAGIQDAEQGRQTALGSVRRMKRSRPLPSSADVVLVSMPFGELFSPSMGLSLLKGALNRDGVSSVVRYFGLPFARRIGRALYDLLSSDGQISARHLAGEWLFARALFDTSADDDTRYINDILRCRSGWVINDVPPMHPSTIRRLAAARRHVDPFLDQCADEILALQPKMVGFTSVFQQHIASLALARRLKARSPGVTIVFGGSNWEGVMGAETVRQFPCVDASVSGEGDVIFSEMVRRVLAGTSIADLEGKGSKARDRASPSSCSARSRARRLCAR